MLNNKKAQGLSVTTIVVAIVGLIVLVILIVILTGRMGDFSKGIDTATSEDNMCAALGRIVDDSVADNWDGDGECQNDGIKLSRGDDTYYCCIKE